MSTYPMLNGRPIDQWMVTELKDELQRRNLPVSGLKDDLVKRLFEAIQDEILDGGEKPRGGTSHPVELKGVETLGPVDASVNQASSEQHVDECVSEVTKQGADLVSSVTEAYDESILATSEVTQEGVVSTAEASQRSLDAVAEVDSSLVDTAATDETNGNGLESASSGNSKVKEANPHSEGHVDTFEKKTEDDTNKEMVVDVASDVTGGDIKLSVGVHRKILEVEDETAPPDDIILDGDNEDAAATAAAESEDDTSKNMVIDDVFPGITHTNVKLGDKVDCKSEQEEVPVLPDATEWQDDPKDAGVVAAAESMIPKENFSEKGLESASSGNTIVKEANPHSETHGDTFEENPEDDTNKKMAVDDVPFDVTGGENIKLGVNVHSKILEVEDLTAPPDDIMLHGDNEDAAAVAAAESEDGTSKNMVIDDVLPDITHTNVKLGVKVDCKTEHEEIPTLPDAIALQDDPKDAGVVAAAENMIPKENFSGNGLESASSGNSIVKEANPHSEAHSYTLEENPEDENKKKMAVDDVPSNVTGGDIKLGVNVHSKILEVEDVTMASDDIMLHGDNEDADAVAAAESEDGTSKNMVIDDVLPDITHTDVRLGVKVDCKTEQEEVPTLPDAIALQDDPKDAGVVVVAESMIPKDNFRENTLMYGNGHEDLKCTNGDSKPILCGTKDQVSEVHPDLDSQIQCVSILHDNISTNEQYDVKGNLTAGNCDLELEAKQEMVKPSSTIPFPGDHLHVLDANKELHKSETSLQELGSTSNIDLDREEESPDGCSHEKLNLDRSSGDESMDEDVTESKHADSNIKSDDLGGKSAVTSAQVLKEVSLLDADAEGSSAHTKEVVAEEKPPTSAGKRKPEDQDVVVNNEPIKRQRLWNVDAVNISDQQASKLIGSGTPKDVFRPALKRSLSRPDTTASRDSPKERIVTPAKKSATTSLRIDGFVRPFTLKAVQEFLGKTGSICSFWMDHIKTHCYVTYSSVEEAVATRNALYNLQWPPNNHSYLVAEFVDPQEVKLKREGPPPSQGPISLNTSAAPQAAPFQQPKANQTLPLHPAAGSCGLSPTPPLAKLLPISGPGPAREMLRPPPPRNLEPPRTLDDLFKKTQAYPRIYYMPLSEEEVSAKLAARDNIKRR